MKPKYTPGPWIIDTETESIVAVDSDACVAVLGGDGLDFDAANALLISKAPDLHEAVKHLVRLVGCAMSQGAFENIAAPGYATRTLVAAETLLKQIEGGK